MTETTKRIHPSDEDCEGTGEIHEDGAVHPCPTCLLAEAVPEEALKAASAAIATSPRKAVYEMADDIAQGALRAALPAIHAQRDEEWRERLKGDYGKRIERCRDRIAEGCDPATYEPRMLAWEAALYSLDSFDPDKKGDS